MLIKAANDRTTYMTELDKCLSNLEEQGFRDQYKLEKGRLHCLTTGSIFSPQDVKAVNFYRFEGVSDPDDMAILYAIETKDGRKGTLIDAYGFYADEEIGEFMQNVEIHKNITPDKDDLSGIE
jgi:hypothetical protein